MLSGCSESLPNQLLSAVNYRDLARVERLLRENSELDVNYQTPRTGETALMNAVSTGDTRLVRLLIEHGADPSLGSFEQQTPLFLAAYHGNVDMAALLVDAGANVNVAETRYGFTALISAAKAGHGQMVRLLLEAGADSNARTGDGRSAKDLAWMFSRQDVVLIFERHDDAQRP